MERDHIRVTYDPGRLTPERIVDVVREQGFQGTILPGEAPDRPREGDGN